MNDLRELLSANVAAPPPDELDVSTLVGAGRRRVRRRRTIAGATALATIAVVAAAALAVPRGSDRAEPAKPLPSQLKVTDAERAAEGRDYDVLMANTSTDLGSANGQPNPSGRHGILLDGVTEDGLVLVRTGTLLALQDRDSRKQDPLPTDGAPTTSSWPVELGADRLVLLAQDDAGQRLSAYLFDRGTRQWSTVTWPGLPDGGDMRARLGPDGRLYVPIPATEGTYLSGTQAGGVAPVPSTSHLWSVSLSDSADVRDEHLTVGELAFSDSEMVWTDGTLGDPGQVHVRTLEGGAERSFDPDLGQRWILLGLSVSSERIVLSEQYENPTGNFNDGRVQVFGTDGAPVTTVAQPGVMLSGGILPGGRIVQIRVADTLYGGTLVLDLQTNRFLRVSDAISRWDIYSVAEGTGDQFFWQTPIDDDTGMTQRLGRLRD